MSPLTFALILTLHSFAWAFPGGAPTESCDSLSPQRGHKARPQPIQNAPYDIIQSALYYNPGDVINVAIRRLNPHASFKGFMVQALDKKTGNYIGHFIEAPGLAVMKECSAVSHSNPKPKIAVHLAWIAPKDHSGQVIFRGTIVETKKIFYEGLQSHVDQN